MGERAIWAHIFTPDNRIAEDRDLAILELFEAALVQPVILADRIRQPVVGAGMERFKALPECRRDERATQDDREHDQPMPAAKPHLVDAENCLTGYAAKGLRRIRRMEWRQGA